MKKWALGLFLWVCFYGFSLPMSGYAMEAAPRISDREIIESLTRLEQILKANGNAIKNNREMIQFLRSEMVVLRNEMVALRNEIRTESKMLRDELLGFMKWGFGLLLSGMFILVGFILWDRRSNVKPVKDEIDELERQKVDRLIAAMKKLSEDDSRIALALRSVGLL